MATANPEDDRDNFVTELHRIKENVRIRFLELRDGLNERETELLTQLDDILSCYQSYQAEVQKKRDIEATQSVIKDLRTTSSFSKNFNQNLLKQLDEEIATLKIPILPKLVRFECDKDRLLAVVKDTCKLVETVRGGVDYASITQPVITVCDRGSGNEQLYYPSAVTVDNITGNIYIVDCLNNSVKVFDRFAKYLFRFGDRSGEGKMYQPTGITICEGRVLVTQHHCVLSYRLDGKFVSKFGSYGSGELQFSSPYNLTADQSNGDIYVCDFGNKRIQIISQTHQFKRQFGQDIIQYPRDIKLHEDDIYILDIANPCLHIFNRDLEIQRSIVSRGKGEQVINPCFFFTDKCDNILISDDGANSILILNSEFSCIHKIPVADHPMGVAVDNEDRIIVVSRADKNCLQIF